MHKINTATAGTLHILNRLFYYISMLIRLIINLIARLYELTRPDRNRKRKRKRPVVVRRGKRDVKNEVLFFQKTPSYLHKFFTNFLSYSRNIRKFTNINNKKIN